MALVSPGVQISVNDQSQYVASNVGSVPLVVLATAQDKSYNGAAATGTSKSAAGKLQSFTSQRDLVTAMGTPSFALSAAGTPINGSELNEYGLMAAYSALGLGNQLYAIRADIDLNQLAGTSIRPAGNVANGTYWLDLGNTEFGIYVFDAVAGAFNHVTPLLITDPTQVVNDNTFAYNVPTPKPSVGQMGTYALVFVDPATGETPSAIRLFYKSLLNNAWVQVGSASWQTSLPVAQATNANPTLTLSGTPATSGFKVNNVQVNFTTATVTAIRDAINGATIPGVTATIVNGLLTFLVTSSAKRNNVDVDGGLVLVETDTTNTPLAKLGTTLAGTYWSPTLFYGTYAQQPSGGWTATDNQPRPSGSIWWKTSSTGTGFSPALKSFSTSLDEWVPVNAPNFAYYADAIANLDPTGGGINIPHGQVISLHATNDTTANNLRFAEQTAALLTTATGTAPTLSSGNTGNTFRISATTVGAQSTSLVSYPAITFSGTTAADFVSAILSANIPYVTAQLNSSGTISIIHTAGGQATIVNVTGTAVTAAGFSATNGVINGTGYTINALTGTVFISNFTLITQVITYSATAPYSAPADQTLWYYSNPADIDIMVNGANGWKGYLVAGTDARGYPLGATDPTGVIVSATQPMSQASGATLALGDLWLNSSDLINFPSLSRVTAVDGSGNATWAKIDNTDHVSNNGIIFADARWDSTGTTDPISGSLPSTVTLLSSNYIDQDAPDYRLYPRGTLLFNTRRSGYNVKKFVSNYFNNSSFPNLPNVPNASGTLPSKTDAWVSVSGLHEDGTLKAGSSAQRSMIVSALQSALDSNTDVIEDNYNFNLLVAPGYPELIPNLVMLNDNRGSTGFVIGDTPMTLAPTATALTAWNNNKNGQGLATASPYLAVYYPAGLTNDLSGNQVAVPASHAVLRTFLYSDNVSYPWFAPAGTHRGLIDNLSDIGYVDAVTGAFIHNGINQGLRDALYGININPITQLPGTGLVVWGQETRSGDATARNRVNVVRLENYLRTIFKSISGGFLFEPNDTVTRKTLAHQIESALHDVLGKRGLYDFLVICDSSNNTSSVIANNQMYVDVAIEPIKDVEFIYIPIALYNPGTIANLGMAST